MRYILSDEDGYVMGVYKNKDDLIDALMMRRFMDCDLEVKK